MVSPNGLFVFDEEGDRKVHTYPYQGSNGTGHFLIQRGSIHGIALLKPESIKTYLNFLTTTDIDTVVRVVKILYINDENGYENLDKKIIQADREGAPINLLEALIVANQFSHLDEAHREDILARRMAMNFVLQNDFSILKFVYDDKDGQNIKKRCRKHS